MNSPALLILAAGMGSRYGGLKQLDPVGPSGETILDFSVFDAMRAGFGKVVFVIRKDFESLFRDQIGRRFEGRMDVDYVFQQLDSIPAGYALPAGREKPWGTGHAIWCAEKALHQPFAVINADDFYGVDAYRQLATQLNTASPDASPAAFSMVGFRLGNTLSEHGAVSRGICAVDENGMLCEIEEVTGIVRREAGAAAPMDGFEKTFSGNELVSMNFWGFTPSIFPLLEKRFKTFLENNSGSPKAEFYIPSAVAEMIASHEAEVKVLPTTSQWFGVTYREDRPRVTESIQDLVKSGVYQSPLWQ
jgi:choline kinase